jgi:hypothetical protein
MAIYNSIITGQTGGGAPALPGNTSPGAGPLIPLEYADEIISLIPAQSVARKMFRNFNMGHAMMQVPVLDTLPKAYWVGNEGRAAPSTPSGKAYGALQQTTEQQWKGVQLTANTLAVDVPIPRVTLADSAFPIWSEVVPLVAGALALALDGATLFGYNSPFVAPALIPASIKAGNVYTLGTNAQDEGGLANDISQLFNLIEASSGFNINGVVASKALKVRIRNARNTLGEQLQEVGVNQWYEQDVNYLAAPGLWPATPGTGGKGTVETAEVTTGTGYEGESLKGTWKVTLSTGTVESLEVQIGDTIAAKGIPSGATVVGLKGSKEVFFNAKPTEETSATAVTLVNPVALAGDFSQAIIGTRQDLEFQVFDTGVIQNESGEITMNLMQQDAVNLRVTARFGFAVANSVTYYQPTESKRFPFAALLS